jgi:pimeloyl-ACP methyl ester carboxylesterase
MSTPKSNRPPIVFIHGLWLHAESWQPWVDLFHQNGHETLAASWPGDSTTTETTRMSPSSVAGYGVAEIADHIAKQFKTFAQKPILIGHSMGGLLAQNLLGRGSARAAIAIDSAPIKGVYQLPLSVIKATLPVLGNPFNFQRAVALTEAQFRFAFANAVSPQESHDLYVKYAMPSPARPLFQVGTATFNPFSETKVDVSNSSRGPLLLVSGLADNTVPNLLVRSTLKLYRKSSAVTEYKEFAGRGHSLIVDSGWRDIAEFCLDWARSK